MALDAPPLCKYLASNDKSTRDNAIQALSQFLSNKSGNTIGERDMAKLWKGIWYCFWMSDKPLVQQALAQELAGLVLNINNTSASLGFLRAFWMTAVREWKAIDHFRLNKFYMLTRRFVNAAFRLLMRTAWDSEACEEWNHMLMDKNGPLCPDDVRVPAGLSFHLADIYLEELEKVLQPTSEPIQPVPIVTVLIPFFRLVARTPSKSTRTHVKTNLLDSLFNALRPASEVPLARKRPRFEFESPVYSNIIANACIGKMEQGKADRAMLRTALSKKIFEIAGEEDTKSANRKWMFAVYRENIDSGGDDVEDPTARANVQIENL